MKTHLRRTDDLVLEALESERRSIGEELHDSVCQSLAAMSMLLESVLHLAEAGRPVPLDRVRSLREGMEESIDRVRAFTRRFNPAKLEGSGLLESLSALSDEIAEERECEFRCEKPVFVSDERIALALYRTAQECCREAIAHSEAKHFVISLSANVSELQLDLYFDADWTYAAPTTSEIMLRRAASEGGKVTFQRKTNGLEVHCRFCDNLNATMK